MTSRYLGRNLGIGVAAVALVLLVSSSLVAAAPLFAHPPPAGTASGSGPSWGHRGPTYPLNFSESGLPAGSSWSVQVFGGAESWGGFSGRSANSSVVLEVPNGTYNFSVGSVVNGSEQFLADPSSGSVSVNGSGAAVAISFSGTPLSVLEFVETGLPVGTFWSVGISGNSSGPIWGTAPSPLCFGVTYWNGSATTEIEFAVPNGSYEFSLPNVTTNDTQFVPSPAVGNVTVNATEVLVEVVFAPVALYNLTFDETGLPGLGPNGTYWDVQLWNASTGGLYNLSAGATVSFEVPNGTYNFTVGNVSGNDTLYVPTPLSGNVTIDGANVSVDVAFTSEILYTVTFAETGLPNGTYWYATLGNGTGGEGFNASTSSTIGFAAPNGTYNFTVGTLFFYPFPEAPTPQCANGSGNGTPSEEYVASPSSGNLTVDGSNVTVPIQFAPLTYHNVTFTETGLPNGTFWSVDLSGGNGFGWNGSGSGGGWGSPYCWGGPTFWNGSANQSIGFTVAPGTYDFSIENQSANGSLYVPSPASGDLTVSGANLTVNVTFSRVTLYQLTFVESGLPNGTLWSVGIWNASTGGSFNLSTNSTIGFEVPNGTYNFTVGPTAIDPNVPFCPNGTGGGGRELFAPSPSNGSVGVDGANVIVSIVFSPQVLYTVTFTETGLPNGTFWWVALPTAGGWGYGHGWPETSVPPFWGSTNGTWNRTAFVFALPNGSYSFGVGNATVNGTTYVPTPSSGNVTVDGANVTVTIQFSAGGDPPRGGTQATAQGPTSGASSTAGGLIGFAGLGVALLVALGVGAMFLWRRRRTSPGASTKAAADSGGADAPRGPPGPGPD